MFDILLHKNLYNKSVVADVLEGRRPAAEGPLQGLSHGQRESVVVRGGHDLKMRIGELTIQASCVQTTFVGLVRKTC